MVRDHPEDQFYFFFDRPFDEKYVYGPNVTPIVIKPMARTAIHWYWWFEKALPQALNKHGIDVFFSPELYTSLSAKTPALLVAHDIAYHHFPEHFPWYHLWYLKKYTPLFLLKADKISCVSSATEEDIIKSFSIDNKKVFVAENGPTAGFVLLDHQTKEEVKNEVAGGNPYFVYLGSIHPRKNVDRLIRAFEMFKKKNAGSTHKLILVGRMAWKTQKVNAALDACTVKKDVLFLGQRTDAARILGGAEALVYVSLMEGFGIPILEAFATGTPVITSNRGAMKEVSGNAALLVEPENIEEIAGVMQKIVSDDKLSGDLVEKGIQRLKHFDWSKSAQKIYKELKSLVN
jgi:glycosyltransferase involved in cell wall biosynthesis